MTIKKISSNLSPFVRTGHALRSFGYQRGDKINLIYSKHPSQEVIEYKNSTFIKCYVRDRVDRVCFIFEGQQYVLPLHDVGVMGVSVDQLR
jgi:hypothetical protein